MTTNISYETDIKLDFDWEDTINKTVLAALEYEVFPYEAVVEIVLTDNAGIHEINLETRGIDAPTDVLSFPMCEYEAPGDFSEFDKSDEYFHPETGEAMLGDIMISVERVLSQAEEYGHSPRRELAFLVAHSCLHLMGYDHMEEDEREDMEARQEEILQSIGITRD